MSFLLKTLPRATAIRSTPAIRTFTTTTQFQKSPVETAKDAAKTVDRAVSDKLVDGIEATQQAAQSVKSKTGVSSTSDIKAKASEVAGQASGKTSELTGEAKGKAHEVAGQAKGKTEEVKGKM